MKFYVVGKTVLNKGYAVVTDGKEASVVEAATIKEAISNAIKTLLEGSVATNEQGLAPQMATIYAADVVGMPMARGTVGDWLRTGKTSKGNPIKQEELVAVRDAYIALTARTFNARIVPVGDVKQGDLANRTMIQQAWAALDRHVATLTPQPSLGLGTIGGLGTPAMNLTGAATTTAPTANAGAMDMNAMMQQMAQMQQMMQMMMAGQMPQATAPTMPVATEAAPTEQPVLGTPASGDMATLLGAPTTLDVTVNTETTPVTTVETTAIPAE